MALVQMPQYQLISIRSQRVILSPLVPVGNYHSPPFIISSKPHSMTIECFMARLDDHMMCRSNNSANYVRYCISAWVSKD
jgi:hypothetical protein